MERSGLDDRATRYFDQMDERGPAGVRTYEGTLAGLARIDMMSGAMSVLNPAG